MKLIDKDVLIAEIKKRRSKNARNKLNLAASFEDNYLLSFLDTLEVKEVDLEKELYDFIKQQKAWIKDDRVVEYDNGDSFNHIYDLEDIAKHFYNLGLRKQKEVFKKESETNCPNFDEA